MPKKPRNVEEIHAVKEKIITEALDLISQKGMEEFSMRKLATRLGIAAKTIYNYYQNKDEIYLEILIKGFESLNGKIAAARLSEKQPKKKLEAMLRAYIDFGTENVDFYALMFTLHVPKFSDYVGTPMESIAKRELDTALQVTYSFAEVVQEIYQDRQDIAEERMQNKLVHLWCHVHGFVAGYNNSILTYMHKNPLVLREEIVKLVLDNL
ncbi:MAG: TetR/AcrR family transcriptional regulator [Spirochaetota bacterium]